MKSINLTHLSLATAALTVLIVTGSCNNNNRNGGNVSAPAANPSAPGALGAQIDRLARPAINEGLSVTDASLNAFNSIPPSADLGAAAQPVVKEATNTLNAFAALGQKLGTTPAPPASAIATAFLPDVMRLDTSLSIPPGQIAYNAATSGSKGILTGGRKIEDPVIHITLSLLVAGDPTGNTVTDNVMFEGVPGNPNQPGHQMLHEQTARMGSATFPFLAPPN